MCNYFRRVRVSAVGLLSITLTTGPFVSAMAQDSAGLLEEIIVTAERRAVSAQKMGVSIVAFTGDELNDLGVQEFADLASVVPSLSYVDNGNTKFVNIRGVGISESAPGQTAGVAVHQDGGYIARENTLHDAFFDIENVEVLRGPQGTYVGQNASGGAIFTTSRQPGFDGIDGWARVDVGNYRKRTLEGAVGGPISDAFAFRVALQSKTRDAFTDNQGTFGAGALPTEVNDPDIVDSHLGRAQLRYRPTEDFDVRLIMQTSERNTNYLAEKIDIPSETSRPRTVNYDINQVMNNKYDRVSLNGMWQANDLFEVRFVTSWQETRQHLIRDDDDTSPFVTSPPIPQESTEIEITNKYYTAEVNLISTSESRLQWIAGATYLDYEAPFTYQAIDYATQPDYDSGLILNFNATRTNVAVFGELNYAVSPDLEIKLGARYNKDDTALADGSFIQPGGPNSSIRLQRSNEADFTEPTGRLLVNFAPSEDQFFYATVAQGYKPGGWEPNGNTYDSEIVLNKEIGWKMTLLDSNLLTSFSLFHMDYDGFQAAIATDPNDPTSAETTNVDGTVIKGVDFQIQAVFGHLELGLSGTYLDTAYGDQVVFQQPGTVAPGVPAVPTPVNLEGREINYAPKWSGYIDLKYHIELGSGASLVPQATWKYQDEQWFGFFHEEFNRLPSYSTGDIRLTYTNAEGNWSVYGYGTNIADELYKNKVSGPYPGHFSYGAPRQYGISLEYRF